MRSLRLGAALVLLALVGAACHAGEEAPAPHYLIDFGGAPEANGDFQVTGHLVVFNPGAVEAHLDLTLYFEDRDPIVLHQKAAPRSSTASTSSGWGVPQGKRFAVEVRSDQPVVCQATIGWTNTGGDYAPRARTSSPRGVREAAKSYLSIRELARRWRIADGIVLDSPQGLWIRESEWALVLNPGDAAARVSIHLYGSGWSRQHELEVPPRRLRAVYMDDVAPRNQLYGVEFESDRPVAAQWVREVRWYDSPEMMAYWSVPGSRD